MNLIKKPIKDIRSLIPQKDPFVMVDTLLSFTENTITAGLTVLENNIFFNNGILVESGLIENMAQTVALHTGYDYFLKNEQAPTGYIGSIKKIKIKALPKLGEVIITKVKILQEFMGVTMVEIEVFDAQNNQIAVGNMKTVIAK